MLKTLTATGSSARTYPEARFVVPGDPAGRAHSGSRPTEVGEVLAGLNIAVAVATGGPDPRTDRIAGATCSSLASRMVLGGVQGRLRTMLGNSPPPPRLHIATECQALDQGGDGEIREWARSRKSAGPDCCRCLPAHQAEGRAQCSALFRRLCRGAAAEADRRRIRSRRRRNNPYAKAGHRG